MSTRLLRTRANLIDAPDTDDAPIRFVLASAGEKRDGLDLSMSRFNLTNFMLNPIMLWMHGHDTRGHMPIGRWSNLHVDSDRITGIATFDRMDPFAWDVERKYRNGFLNAVSVSWLPTETPAGWSYDLLETSAVSVPADPSALALSREFPAAILEWEAERARARRAATIRALKQY